jgi:hypothetical protein
MAETGTCAQCGKPKPDLYHGICYECECPDDGNHQSYCNICKEWNIEDGDMCRHLMFGPSETIMGAGADDPLGESGDAEAVRDSLYCFLAWLGLRWARRIRDACAGTDPGYPWTWFSGSMLGGAVGLKLECSPGEWLQDCLEGYERTGWDDRIEGGVYWLATLANAEEEHRHLTAHWIQQWLRSFVPAA